MLALRAWRSSLLVAARRPALVAKYSDVADMLDGLDGDIDVLPPTAGNGYPVTGPRPANAANPFDVVHALDERPVYRLHCQATKNNTITTFTDEIGNVKAWYSGGRCGFKKGQRATYEAGYQCAVRMFKDIEKVSATKTIRLELFLKGFGQGRDAMQKALMTAEGDAIRQLMSSVTDRTRIKVGGTRAKKRRRL